MRFAVLADIHGNLPALEAVLEDIQHQNTDGIIVLGDIPSRGPFPAETLERVHATATVIIRGNGDGYLLDFEKRVQQGERPECYCRAIDSWTYDRIGQPGLDIIRTMPLKTVLSYNDAEPLCLVHGSAERENEWIIPDDLPETLARFQRASIIPASFKPQPLSKWFRNIPQKALACGHSHIPWQSVQNGYMIFNPGAVGMPINEDTRAQYALITWEKEHWKVEFRALEYDMQRTARAYKSTGMLEACGGFARVFLNSMLTGRNYLGFYLIHADCIARRNGYAHYDKMPDSLWREVEATFAWGIA